MAGTAAYRQWLAAGRPQSTARPIAELAALLRKYGYTVYVIGNDDHLTSNPPEDHTPFSATGWPNSSPRWVIFACDIMPPASGKGLPSLAQLGAQLAADRTAGVPGIGWLKYMNWQPAGGGIRHEAWDPGHRITGSTDGGHIHISARSDSAGTGIGGYDPVARIRGGGAAPAKAESAARSGAPAWPGRYIKLAKPMMHGEDVRAWQARMKQRGWDISADGWFGQESDNVLYLFQLDKHLTADRILGPASWVAAWDSPVT